MKLVILASVITLFSSQFKCFSQVEPIQELREPVGKFEKNKYVKVAVLQWAPSNAAPLDTKQNAENYKKNNRQLLAGFITEAVKKGAEIVITPEFGVVGYPDIPELSSEDDNFRSRDDIKFYVEEINGQTVRFFQSLAMKLKVTIHFGFALKEGEKYFNAVAVVDGRGKLLAVHRKKNLFKQEADYLSAGTSDTIYDSGLVGKVGLLICADVYDQDLLTIYARKKVNLLALSTSWAQYNTGWDYFSRAAQQVGVPLLASNHNYFPDSGVIFQDGTFHSHLRQSDGLAYGYILKKLK